MKSRWPFSRPSMTTCEGWLPGAQVQQSFDQLRVHLDPEAVQDAFMMVTRPEAGETLESVANPWNIPWNCLIYGGFSWIFAM